MAIKAEHTFTGLDTDNSPKSKNWVPGSYRYGRNIRVGSSQQSNIGAVENIQGNTLVEFELPAGTNKCNGGHEDIASNSVFYFIWNSNDKHGIYKYSGLSNSIAKIFPIDEDADDILEFQENKLITGTGFTNNMLFWTFGEKPRCLNVVDAIAYPTPYLEAYIDFVKIPPTKPITCVSSWVNEGDVIVPYLANSLKPNFMSNRSYQFRYRYIYKDNQRSVWSVLSKLIPTGYAQDFKNKIVLTIDNDEVNDAVHYSKVITSIEISFRDGNSPTNGDAVPFKLITRIPFPTSDGPVTYDFRNDKAYTILDPNETSLLFHTVPLKSNALALAKSRVFLGGNTEGFAVPQEFTCTVPVKTVIASPVLNNMYLLSGSRYSVGVAFYERADRKCGAQELFGISTDERHGGAFQPNKFSFTLSGKPPVWATHWQVIRTTSKNKSYFIQVLVSIVSQNIDTVVFNINNLNSANVAYNFSEGDRCSFISRNINGDMLRSAMPDLNLPQDNCQVVKQEGGNITVKWVQGTNTGSYALQTGALVELYSPILPDSVEEYFEIGERYPVIFPGDDNRRFGNDNLNTGKNLIIGDGLVDRCGDIHYRDITKPVGALSNAYAFYSWLIADGKNMHLFQPISITYTITVNGRVYSHTLIVAPQARVVPSVIVGALITQMLADPANEAVITNTDNTITVTSKVPGNYPFSASGTFSTSGSGEISKTPIVPNGSRTPAEAGVLNVQNKIEAMASNDDFYENWQKNIGRPNVVFLETEREIYKYSAISYGGQLVQDTQINALCAFTSDGQSVLPIEFGELTKLQVAANNQAEGAVLLSIHSNEIASLYIEQATIQQGAGGQLTANTDSIIGSINPLAKGIGCINPESVKQINGRVYGYDLLRGIVWRYAQNGLDAISEIGKRNFFYEKSEELLSDEMPKIYGGIDPYHNEYMLTMPGDDDTLRTIAWNETTNRWSSYYSFIGENYNRINTNFISFKDGSLWIHNSDTANNFYGVQYTSLIDAVCNQEHTVMKILEGVELISDDLWNAIDIATPEGQSSELLGVRDPLTAYDPPQDFFRSENTFYGNVMRDKNTPNETYPLLKGDLIRSQVFTVLLECEATSLTALYYLNLYYIYSQQNKK